MDADEKSKLHHLLELTEENNHYIKKLYRHMQWRKWIGISYWVVIIALSFGAYYLVQPYLETLDDAYEGLRGQFFGSDEVSGRIIDSLPGAN